jgi:hypothetical protein
MYSINLKIVLSHCFKDVAYYVTKDYIFTLYYLYEKLQNPLKVADGEHKCGNRIMTCLHPAGVSGIKRI